MLTIWPSGEDFQNETDLKTPGLLCPVMSRMIVDESGLEIIMWQTVSILVDAQPFRKSMRNINIDVFITFKKNIPMWLFRPDQLDYGDQD